ncbi:la-related protein 1C-like isoform X4 [Ipomoea triloba]|uniref:la-related protein 1C-like isoform X4 n=1 Tax=Ipomoea triloba TaxID=35885 RepID=UPI00125DF561|nr:la-related protein 1C-like isoform X4 [Ipomoea triloba]
MAADCNSPKKHKSPPPPSSPIPWAQVVRGDSEAKASSTPRSPSNPSENNNALLNKENKFENKAATLPVIGGEVSWPALSECTRSNSPKIAASLPQVSQEPVVQQSSQKQHNHNSHPNSNSKHSMAGRQRSMKHRSGAPGQGGFSRQPPLSPSPPPFPIFEMPYGNLIPAVMDPSMVGLRPAVGGVVHLRPNYSSPNNLPRRESSGARPHGDWTYNQGNMHNHGRRDPRHGGFIPSPPPSSPPFLPQAVGSLGCPIGFDVASPFMSYIPTLQGMPPPPPSMIYPIDLSTSLLKQIDYYFRSKMDSEGWVPINLIANFPRVRQLTNNVLFILNCLKASKVVEVQGERIRRRDNWKKWIHSS